MGAEKEGWDWWGTPRQPRRRSPMDSGNNRNDKSCCYGAAAIQSIKKGQYRLARRYARMSVRAIAARMI